MPPNETQVRILTRELRKAGRTAERYKLAEGSARAVRDSLIVEAKAAGMTVPAIARAAAMTEPNVKYVLNGRHAPSRSPKSTPTG